MIRHHVYSPLLKEKILIEAESVQTLKRYIEITKDLQQSCRDDSEQYRRFQCLIDAYVEVLDMLERGEI